MRIKSSERRDKPRRALPLKVLVDGEGDNRGLTAT